MPDDAKPDYTALDFPDPPADRPYIYVNMVMSTDGKVVIEGTEQGLGSPIDQRLMRELRVSAGAEFLVAVCGDVMTMPGLPRVPAAESIRLNDAGEVEGLF